jgi:hypothetical protein
MSEERNRILKMVEDGAVSASEAEELLASIEGGDEDLEATGEVITSPLGDEPWEVPVIAGTVLSGFGLLGILRGRGGSILSRVGAWGTLLLGLVAVVVGIWSRNAPWLHVRVKESDGDSIHIRLPLPLGLGKQILSLARGFVDEETAEQLDSAMTFIDGLQHGEQQDPLSIEVDDGQGSQVQVSIG